MERSRAVLAERTDFARKPPRFYADWAFWILVGPSLTAALLVLVTR